MQLLCLTLFIPAPEPSYLSFFVLESQGLVVLPPQVPQKGWLYLDLVPELPTSDFPGLCLCHLLS